MTPPSADVSLWPLAVLGLCVGLIVFLITVLRVHAFLALVLAAIAAGMLSAVGSLPGDPGTSHWVQAVELTAREFGVTAGKIGIVIALASVIGVCMMESGAADKVVRRFLAVFGERRAGLALLSSTFLLSMPIFFDTYLLLVLPIARALAVRVGRHYTLYVLAIASAGVVTHGLIAPHPGPLAMAEILKIDVGATIVAGIAIGVIPVLASWPLLVWIDRRLSIPVRAAGGSTPESIAAGMDRPESALPPFWLSLSPVILPILLISLASTLAAFPSFRVDHAGLYRVAELVGNRNIALLIGAVLAIGVLVRQRQIPLVRVGEVIGPAFEAAGVIILITSAGGAFGLMLKNAGVGDTIRGLAVGRDIDLILLAWLMAAVIRVAQGSATVASLTTAAMLQPMIAGTALPYHPVYIFAAIAFGGMVLSWMNDSGFWVVSRMAGFTEKETLRSWTVVLTFNGAVGLLVTLILSRILPLTG